MEVGLEAITGKLRQTDEATPGYWPTVLRFIPVASSMTAPKAPPRGQRPRALSDILAVGLMRGVREEGTTILFDSGDLGKGEFTSCRIIFTENPVRLTHVVFRNCVFELPTADLPSPYLRKVSQMLLASKFSSVSTPTL